MLTVCSHPVPPKRQGGGAAEPLAQFVASKSGFNVAICVLADLPYWMELDSRGQ